MYKQKNNFSFLNVPSVDKKQLAVKEAKRSFLNESLDINALNALYQPKEVSKEKQTSPAQAQLIPNNPELQFNNLSQPATNDAQLKQGEGDSLLLGVSKPFKISFTNLQPTNQEFTEPVMEEIQVLDDEVLAPLNTIKIKIKKENEKANKEEDLDMSLEDAIKHAEEVANSCDGKCSTNHQKLADWLKDYKNLIKKEPGEVDEKPKTDESTEEKELSKEDYDFLVILPSSEVLPKDLIDIVNKAGQGMISNPVMRQLTDLPLGQLSSISKIQSIEDDPEGLSVAGMDNDIGIRFMKKK